MSGILQSILLHSHLLMYHVYILVEVSIWTHKSKIDSFVSTTKLWYKLKLRHSIPEKNRGHWASSDVIENEVISDDVIFSIY